MTSGANRKDEWSESKRKKRRGASVNEYERNESDENNS